MSEIVFYEMNGNRLGDMLPDLLSKVYDRGWRAQIICDNKEQVDFFNQHLWTYAVDSFLPHGTTQDEAIFLTDQWVEIPFDILFFLSMREGSFPFSLPIFQSCLRFCVLFDGTQASEVALYAKTRKVLENENNMLLHWKQNNKGKWIKN